MKFNTLTQIVKSFPPGAQFQQVRSYRIASNWALSLDFYPGPRQLLFARAPDADVAGAWTGDRPSGVQPAPSPLQLYLKAHFANLRVRHVEQRDDSSVVLEFLPRLCRMTLRWKGPHLEAVLSVPERKDYVQSLSLAALPVEWTREELSEGAAETKGPIPQDAAQKAVERKEARLMAKIQADIDEGQTWLDRFGPICDALEADATRWKSPESWEPEQRALLEAEIQAGRLPPWGAQSLGRAQDLLYQSRRRSRRKVEGGKKRLAQAESRAPSTKKKSSEQGAAAASGSASVPRKKPGLWVELVEGGLWARVGRSALENAELFRQARDRDLWFHVHGQTGAHVWIPRGQPRLGSKAEASEEILRLGAQLALFNSKARESGGADVDCTERRHLRAIKGVPGKLEILRSTTRFVRLDEAFEKRILGK